MCVTKPNDQSFQRLLCGFFVMMYDIDNIDDDDDDDGTLMP
jgi:hypothetical protein